MAIEPPPWATLDELDEHGRLFVSLFRSREHFDSWRATGSLAQPKAIRGREKLKANPMRMAREELRRIVGHARRNLKRTEGKLVKAREELPSSLFTWRTQSNIERLTHQLETRRAALASAETDLALFDEFNSPKGNI